MSMSKATGYRNRVYTIEYDMHGMISAYGIQFVLWLAGEVSKGRFDIKQAVLNWQAQIDRTGKRNFARELDAHPERYEDERSARSDSERDPADSYVDLGAA